MITIKNIGLTLNTINKQTKIQAIERQKKITIELKDKLVMATPIDTGNARAGWRIDNGNLVNDVAYMSELNDGHSPQAPERFIERVILSDTRVKANGIIVTDKE